MAEILPDVTTLDALPDWTAPHMTIHLGELSGIASRLGNSWLLDFVMDVLPERRGILEWLQSFPVQTASLASGLSRDNEGVFQGALRFDEGKQEILSLLEELSPSSGSSPDEARWKMGSLIIQLLDIPISLLQSGIVRLDGDFVEERPNLFTLNIELQIDGKIKIEMVVSVAEAGGENILLFASSPEEIDRAANALKDETARMRIVRRDPAKANFLQMEDDDAGSETLELAKGLSFKPRAAAQLEFSAGLLDGGFGLSLQHNFFPVILGDYPRPDGAWREDDGGFAFGGGSPWIAGALSLVLTEQTIQDVLTAATGDANQARGILPSLGVDPAALSEALRSAGLVFGGNALIHDRLFPHPEAPVEEKLLPGGYAFVSGDAEHMRSLVPLLKPILAEWLGKSVRETEKEAWDFFYELEDEQSERAAGLPFFAGLRDGVFAIGVLDGDYLEELPEVDWGEKDRDGSVLVGCLDFSQLVSQSQNLVATMPLYRLREALGPIDLDDAFAPRAWADIFKLFAALQEVKQVRLDMPNWECINLDVTTGQVDYENVWDLLRTYRALESRDRDRF